MEKEQSDWEKEMEMKKEEEKKEDNKKDEDVDRVRNGGEDAVR